MPDFASIKRDAAQVVHNIHPQLVGVSHFLHANPEIGFQETQACRLLSDFLEQRAFCVERGAGNLPTAFVARFGTGPLHIAICAEYDALPAIGHACGHNLIAASALGAAVSLMNHCEELGLTISVIGTPAEEGGGGKTLLLQQGVFDGVCAAMMIHPSAIERDAMNTLAVSTLRCEYFGVAAHAAAQPEAGKNAASALALAQSGIAFLREHLHSSDRVHGIVVDGGAAPNIVPAYTAGRFFVRSATTQRLKELEHQVRQVFRGAATMTGTSLRITKTSPTFAELRTNTAIAKLWRANAEALGRSSLPAGSNDPVASTDMGNVSHAIPSIHPMMQLEAGGANIHQQAFADAANGSDSDNVILDGATAMAWTIADIAADAGLSNALSASPYRVADAENRGYLDEAWEQPEDFDPAGC